MHLDVNGTALERRPRELCVSCFEVVVESHRKYMRELNKTDISYLKTIRVFFT